MTDGLLADLVDQITAKAVGPKPASARYVGLEHIEPSARRLSATSPASISDSTNGVFEIGDILFGKLRPNLRKSVQVDFGGFCSTDLIIMRPKAGVVPEFAAHVASSEAVFRHAERNSIGTGMPRTSWRAVAKAPCTVPPLEEQRRIAEILDTIDETIQASERVIAKLRMERAGIVASVFQEGALVALGALGEFTNGLNKPAHAFGRGTRFINISDVYPDQLDIESLGRMVCSEREVSRFGLKPGDILIDRSSVKLDGVGYPTLFGGSGEPVVFCGFIIRLRPVASVYPAFLVHQMRSPMFRLALFRIATVSANVNVNQAALSKLTVRLPAVGEQHRVAELLNHVSQRLSDEEASRRKLLATRSGLAHDLLSGKVRTVAA